MKKERKVSAVDLSLPGHRMGYGEGERARFKIESLRQDFEVLVKENESMKKRLQVQHRKKRQLAAEVNFLRRKYECFVKSPPQNGPCLLNNASQEIIPLKLKQQSHGSDPVFRARGQKSETRPEFRLKQKKPKEQDAATPSMNAQFDLNLVTMPEAEEDEYRVAGQTHKAVKTLEHYPVEVASTTGNVKPLLCRSIGTKKSGKRKISWQDPVALRV